MCGGNDKRVDTGSLSAKAADTVIPQLVTDHDWRAEENATKTITEDFETVITEAVDIHTLDTKSLTFEGHFTAFGKGDPASSPGQKDTIMWLAISPDAKLVGSTSWDGTVRIWDTNGGTCLQVLGPFGGQMWSGVFSLDSKYITFSQGSPKATVYVYNLSSAEEISRFKLLAVGASDSTLRALDPYTGEEKMKWTLKFEVSVMRRFAEIRGVRFIDKGRKLMFRSGEGSTEVYDLTTNSKLLFARGPGDQVEKMTGSRPVCFSNSSALVVPDVDGAVRFWRLQ
ncbi:WD40 repeat domain-containing protein [Aspergillus alliaceus]|uniref:WD40 repeat domain-containing protein n=1 Tax=Petromyces alliaceus TaxID=209559 RepID=UPI0012A486AC|nr:quinon protein alcohol dehydrogenase-like superfamily [Aspergillus alliaceus]KAB8237042.1 quinon protein alcohol dehydrogenase-like superfamily [Aspergillus alliaceus]